MTAVDDALDRLRQVAEAADDEGRPWEWEHAYPQRVTRVGDVILIADCYEDPDAPSRFAEFIATFDPPTVLPLLAELQRLRDERDSARSANRELAAERDAAEAEVRRLTGLLREIEAKPYRAEEITARALLANSPPEKT